MHKVLCTVRGYPAEAAGILETIGPTEVRAVDQAALYAAIADATCLVIQLGLTIDKAVIDAAPRLRYIAAATTGLDHIDLEYAAARGIEVLSLSGETELLAGITPTAELALGLMIALARRIPDACAAVGRYEWNAPGGPGQSLAGKTLGIVGVGRLGGMMAQYGRALRMDVIGCDPRPSRECPLVPFDTLVAAADVVSVHVPLSPSTAGMFDARVFARMKRSAYLINVSRGGVVDEAALLDALEHGRLGGYATDVLAGETGFASGFAPHPLVEYARTHPNVLITPHIGGTTVEARYATDMFIARKLQRAVGIESGVR